MVNKITDFVSAEVEEFGCLNSHAKSKMLCGMIGDIFVPPAGVVALLKYGKAATKEFPKLTKLFELGKKTKVTTHADAFKKYPKLKKSYNEIGVDIPAAKLIINPKEINFKLSDNFRPVKSEEMKKRALELDPK